MPRRASNLPRSFIDEHRRQRLARATAEVVREEGREALTVAETCRRARMGRAGYYKLFGGVSACLAYCFERGFESAAAPLHAAGALQRPYAERVGAAIGELYAALAAEPLICELCLVHSFGAKEAAGRDQPALVALAARLLADRGAAPGAAGEPAPGLREDYVAGMIVWRGAERLRCGEVERLAADGGQLAGLALEFLDASEAPGGR